MKKYFLFDNEPINGITYLLRIFAGTILIIVFVGFWLLAATGYKRAGAFGWSKEMRVVCSVAIPLYVVFNVLVEEINNSNQNLNLFLLSLGFLHLVLLFKNGNKIKIN